MFHSNKEAQISGLSMKENEFFEDMRSKRKDGTLYRYDINKINKAWKKSDAFLLTEETERKKSSYKVKSIKDEGRYIGDGINWYNILLI